MSTPLAKKVFELFGKPELAKEAEQQAGAQAPPANLRALYHHAAETVREECFSLDACWLLDHHPELWEQLRTLDDELTAMEHGRAEAPAYRATLARLVACVQQARALYEQERSIEAVQ